MPHSSKTIAIIPARSGSKRLPHKNIRSFRGKPLLGIAIEQSLAVASIDRTLVSTDDESYAQIARSFGAEVPFLRPAELSEDQSTDLEVFQHALAWMQREQLELPELIVHLRPTYPTRTPHDIHCAIELLRSHPEWDSVRSVCPASVTPSKLWWLDPGGTLSQIAQFAIPESHSLPYQLLPSAWMQNACVDVIRTATILGQSSMAGKVVGGFQMNHHFDIDTGSDFERASLLGLTPEQLKGNSLTFCIDIDGVIATLAPENDYRLAKAQSDAISAVNALFEAGHRIILFTARGSTTGLDWTEYTASQLAEWGVKHHELLFGKPAADIYIDDRCGRIDTLLRLGDVTPPTFPESAK